LHGCFPLFNSANLGHRRPLVQQRGKLVKLRGSTDRVNPHPAIVFIADPPANTDAVRVLQNEPAESYTLHPPGYKPLARFGRGCLQEAGSVRPSAPDGAGASIIALISARKAFTVKGFVISRKPLSMT